MFEIKNIDFKLAIQAAKDNHFKIVILFLYTSKENYFAGDIGRYFEVLDYHSGRNVAFISNYYLPESGGHPDDFYEEYRRSLNAYRNRISAQMAGADADTDPYRNMLNIAKAFECGMENRLPCFAIFDPDDPQFFVEKRLSDPQNVFQEAEHILTDISSVGYDIHAYASTYKEPYYYLSTSQMLTQNINAMKYQNIRAQLLFDAIWADQAEGQYSKDEIKQITNQWGYIPISKFLQNYDRIHCRDGASNERVGKCIDKIFSLISCNNQMVFPEIAEYIEQSSADCLRTISYLREFEAITKHSFIAICLGKVVEDEMNLGIFNAFRGEFGIKLPDYFDRHEPGKGNLKVNLEYPDINGNKFKMSVAFNDPERNSSKLQYPKVSSIRTIAFNRACTAPDSTRNNQILSVRQAISTEPGSLSHEDFADICEKLKIIAEARNSAIHRAAPLTETEGLESLAAFQSLVEMKFFEMNHRLKSITRN